MLIKVFFSDLSNRSYLRFLFPGIQFALDGHPVYAKIVLSKTHYLIPDGTLFLLQDPSGFALESLGGFCRFLSQIHYMPAAKVEKLERWVYPSITAMYLEAVFLHLRNKSWMTQQGLSYAKNPEKVTSEDKQKAWQDSQASKLSAQVAAMVKLPLGERIVRAEALGFAEVLSYLLHSFKSFWDRSMQGGQRKDFGPVASSFNRDLWLKEYQISEDPMLDCSLLLSYFRG